MVKLMTKISKVRPKIVEPVLDSITPLLTSCLPLGKLSCIVPCIKERNQDGQKNRNKKFSSLEPAGRVTWCTIAYWEEKSRVGSQVKCSGVSTSIQLASSPPLVFQDDVLALRDLQKDNRNPSEATILTRQKIGMGVKLEKDETGLWVHNRSMFPVFVNSPTMDTVNSRQFSVVKIPQGFSLQVFSFEVAKMYEKVRDPKLYDGPVDPYSVRLSFAKGWGLHYKRQSVECCPCWVEVFLSPS